MASTLKTNIIEVNIEDAKELIVDHCADIFLGHAKRKSVIMEGGIGVGKSQIINELPKELAPILNVPEENIIVHEVYPGGMDETAIQGALYVADGVTRSSTPFWWPHLEDFKYPDHRQGEKEEGIYHIVFFDELMNAKDYQQQACYRPFLNYSIQNNKKLHDNVIIIGAGNRKCDKTSVTPLLPTVVNRAGMFISIKEELKTLLNYALREKFETSIYAFLSEPSNKDYHYVPPEAPSTPFPSHRSWENFDVKLKSLTRKHGGTLSLTNPDGSTNMDLLYKVKIAARGTVGDEVAQKFASFLEYYEKLPNWGDVISGRLTPNNFGLADVERSIVHSIMISAAMLITTTHTESSKEELIKVTKAILPWISHNRISGNRDMAVTFVQLLMANDGPHMVLLNNCSEYVSFVRPLGAGIQALREQLAAL